MTRVVPAGVAASDRAQQIAQRAIAEEVERLVGDFEFHRRRAVVEAAARALSPLAFLLQVGGARDEPLFHHALDDLLNEILELLARLLLVAVGRLTEELLDGLVRQHAAAEQRLEDGIVQRLHRAVLFVARAAPRIVEPAREQQVGQLRHEIVDVDLVEQAACVLRVAVFHGILSDGRWWMVDPI